LAIIFVFVIFGIIVKIFFILLTRRPFPLPDPEQAP